MKRRSAIKTGLFASAHHCTKIDDIGDPLQRIEHHINFVLLAQQVDEAIPRPNNPKGGRPPFSTETMVRILVLKRLYNLSDEQMEFQLLDRISYQRFCGLAQATNIPDKTAIWLFENRIGVAGAVLFDGMIRQLLNAGCIARDGQVVDATLVPAPRQRIGKAEKEMIEQNAMPD